MRRHRTKPNLGSHEEADAEVRGKVERGLFAYYPAPAAQCRRWPASVISTQTVTATLNSGYKLSLAGHTML